LVFYPFYLFAQNNSQSSSDTVTQVPVSRDINQVAEIIGRGQGRVQEFHQEFRSRDIKISGEITFSILIAKSGKVLKLKTLHSSIQNKKFKFLLIKEIKSWIFSPAKETTEVEVPFSFEARPDEYHESLDFN